MMKSCTTLVRYIFLGSVVKKIMLPCYQDIYHYYCLVRTQILERNYIFNPFIKIMRQLSTIDHTI